MKTFLQLRNGSLVPSTEEQAEVTVYIAPPTEERQEIIQASLLDHYDIESALDPDEISRVQFYPDSIYVVWKRPMNVSFDQQLRMDVSSVGLFLHQNKLQLIMSENILPFSAKEFQGVESAMDVLLRFFLHTVHQYLGHLKVIKQLTVELEAKISSSMENRYLLQMFALSESLIYYLNAIEANETALSKLRGAAEKLGLTRQHIEFLDDVLLDNHQCAKQAQIFTTVLSGLMDARGNIVNNNMNVLLKNLTLINIIFLPLNLIASILGMSEFSMMTHGVNWILSFSLFSLGMVLLGWVTWIILIRVIEKRQRPARRKKS